MSMFPPVPLFLSQEASDRSRSKGGRTVRSSRGWRGSLRDLVAAAARPTRRLAGGRKLVAVDLSRPVGPPRAEAGAGCGTARAADRKPCARLSSTPAP